MKLNTLNLTIASPLQGYGWPRTHEGGLAVVLTPEEALRRSVLACMLWEDEFYESGVTIAALIRSLVPQVARKANRRSFHYAGREATWGLYVEGRQRREFPHPLAPN